MNKKKYIVLTIISVLSFILITAGVTYAFFSYIGEGSTENTVESGSIKFIYEEVNKMGNGISITDAMPVSDTEGKASNNYFDFKVTSTTSTTQSIPYEITTRVTEGSDDLSDYVKLYLTKVNGANEQQVALSMYSSLNDSTNTLVQPFGDKTLYNGEIPVGAVNYTENYRLRMWLTNDSNDGRVLDYSPVYECSDTQYTNQTDCESNNGVWNPTNNYNNQSKTFSIKINVYANGEQASQQKITTANSVGIKSLTVNDVDAYEAADNEPNYDYYKAVEDDVTQAEIEVETDNPNATITVENITNTAMNTNIRRISTVRLFDLINGDNFFKITVTSENKQLSESYILKVRVGEDAGLYASDGRQLASWGELVENGMNETTCANISTAINAVRNGETDLKVVISKNATSIAGDAFRGNSYVTSVVVSDSVTSIGYQTFMNASNLKSVKLGKNVKSLSDYAFATCPKLETINFPSSLTSIGQLAFSGDTSLTEITFSSVPSISSGAFNNCKNLTTVNLAEGLTTTPAFNNSYLGSYVTTVNLPSTLTSISNNAFSGFSKLVNVTIPNGVTSIGSSAFSSAAFTTLTIPESVTSIGSYAFSSSKLESITLPSGLTSLGGSAFRAATNLESITIPDGITALDTYTFYGCTGLKHVTLSNNLKSMSDYAFAGCTSLEEVVLPASLTSIGQLVFSGDTSIASVTVNSSSTSMGLNSFRNCSNLKTLTLVEGLTTTPSFKDTDMGSYVTTVNLPSTLTSISNNAFSGFTKLVNVTIPSGVTSIGSSAFSGAAFTTITIPSSVTTLGSYAFNGSKLESITIPSTVTNIGSYLFNGCSNLTSVSIPDAITSLPSHMFRNCTSLKNITLPSTLTSIDQYAFYSSGLESLTIPATVRSIGQLAFAGCNSLASVTFNNPNGWRTENRTLDLSDPATNATYLKSTYRSGWSKSN